jgi:hypothetical protein
VPSRPFSGDAPELTPVRHNGRVELDRRHAAVLLGVAAWNVVTWSNFAKNLAGAEGRPTGYYVAHGALIVANLGIAAVLGTMGWRAWRSAR